MIVYSATKSGFREDVRLNRIEATIEAEFRRRLGHSTGAREIASWKNSMLYMSNAIEDAGIPDDAGVAIEYRIPQTSKRVDFILTGRDENGGGAAVIVELKQWSDVDLTEKDGIVRTYVGGAPREVSHPSYQAWTYAALLRDFNEAVQQGPVALRPCAYLHNLETGTTISDPRYADDLEKAPAFIRSDAELLTAFIKRFIRHGDGGRLMFEIDNSRIRPSKNLADELVAMLQGNQAFVMIDDQKLVFETAMEMVRKATVKDKHVLIVEGGPGTGKSVVAINLIVRLTGDRLTTQYITRNAAPRAVYQSVLTGSFKKSHITNLFTGSGAFIDCDPNTFDALIVDEAHRLNEQSGLYGNRGENQIKEIISAARSSVFFIDEDQRVTWKDVGSVEEIEQRARECGASVQRMKLESQFRCNGSDGYLAWLDNALQIRPTANEDLSGIQYDFRVCKTPNELMQLIEERNAERNKARAVAGYCWDWVTRKPERRDEYDIVIEEHDFRRRWNLDKDGSLWIRMPHSVNEVGCIHTCQGLEVDYIGVIIGPDLVVRDEKVEARPEHRSRMDQSIKGYKKALRANPEAARAKVDLIVRNTYRTLMSRGQKGCYLYCTDPETAEYFESMTAMIETTGVAPPASPMPANDVTSAKYPGLSLRILDRSQACPCENCVPIYDLAAAAGNFSPDHADAHDWVELPDSFRPHPDHFVVRVIGESMNRRIPSGSWCLFKANPGGSRNGKIVLVEHRDIQDPETGGSYTVKRYRSEKNPDDDSWRHERIVLSPESTIPGFTDIVLEDSAEQLRLIGEFIAVLD